MKKENGKIIFKKKEENGGGGGGGVRGGLGLDLVFFFLIEGFDLVNALDMSQPTWHTRVAIPCLRHPP